MTASRDPAVEIECPRCGAAVGNPCVGNRAVHPSRREASYKARYPFAPSVPLTADEARRIAEAVMARGPRWIPRDERERRAFELLVEAARNNP